jgi:hypothetical protein
MLWNRVKGSKQEQLQGVDTGKTKEVLALTSFFLLYLYHQSNPDYTYMYVGSTKWQYRIWLDEQYFINHLKPSGFFTYNQV